MWFTMALLTILAWGFGDLFTKKGTKPGDTGSHLRMVAMVGLVMGLHAAIYQISKGIAFSPSAILTYLPVSAMYILSMALGYAGLRYIELSVSSPVCNSSGAITAILCAVFLNQRMTGLQLAAVIAICAGLVLLALLEKKDDPATLSETEKKYRIGAVAILFPLLYCVIDGLGTFMDAYYLENIMDEDTALLAYEYTFLIVGALAYAWLRLVRREKRSLWGRWSFAAAALCETAGQFTYVYAMGDNAIVAAPMIASYSIVSVLLSRLVLKEKLNKGQYIVIAVIMAGIAILGME